MSTSAAPSIRDRTASEEAPAADVFRRVREHYRVWCGPNSEGYEYDLLAFAYYEG